jgi:zona occludens toxin (predicted ATPase)
MFCALPPGYRDIFGARDARKGPLLLLDGTSIVWPKGWTEADAARWREASSGAAVVLSMIDG